MIARYESWWMNASASREKLAVFRVAFFAIVGVDAMLQISHAPRYGGFNVANLPIIASVLPELGRTGMMTVWVLQAYLAVRIAVGGATRWAVVALCCLFGYAYFISQLDSYQHHYLVFLALVLCCFVRWDRPGKLFAGKLESAWPIRTLLVVISIVYVFAAIAKLEAAWIDGTALTVQLSKPWVRQIVESWFGAPIVRDGALVDAGGYGTVAAILVLAELFLAIAIHIPKLRIAAFIVGVGLHLGFEFSGFEIGLFSYFMCAIYTLVLPDRWFVAMGRWLRPAFGMIDGAIASLRSRVTGSFSATWATAAVCFAGGAAGIAMLPYDGVTAAIVLVIVLGFAGVMERRRGSDAKRRAVASMSISHLVACVAIILTSSVTGTARDYHRYWAASLREMGNIEQAVPTYERAVELDPDYAPGHSSLANLYRRTGRHDEALEHYAIAQRLEPDNWRPYAGEAMTHDAMGRGGPALEAAQKALARNPNHGESQRIRARWENAQ